MKKRFKSFVLLLACLSPQNVLAGNLSPSVDLLVWHASQETSSFWASVVTEPVNNELVYTPPNNRFNWDPGVRIVLSFGSVNPFWDASVSWTYFSTEKENHLSLTDQIIAPEFFSGFLSKDIFFGAHLNWQLMMHTVDLKMSHAFHIGQSFTLCPTVGIKAGSIHQNIQARWDAVLYESTEKLKHHFNGIGPRFGVETAWRLSPQWCLLGNISTALMWGKWKIEDTYQRPDAFFGLVTPTTIITSMNDPSLGTAMFEYFLGVEWQLQVPYDIVFQLGYETQFWANQLRLTTFQILPLHGDLTLQGGTCRFQINLP